MAIFNKVFKKVIYWVENLEFPASISLKQSVLAIALNEIISEVKIYCNRTY